MELNFNSVETIPNLNASAAFQVDSGKVFKEDVDIVPVIIDDKLSYIPWGGDNNMPYNILNLIESDETLATSQMFNAEVCYGSGLQYNTDSCGGDVKQLIGMAKEAKLKNIAPIKYQIEISNKYWDSIFNSEGITDRREQQKFARPIWYASSR